MKEELLYFGCGAISGAIGDSIVHPIDTIRCRLQVQHSSNIKYRSTYHTLRTILKQEGINGLFGGLGTVLLFTIPAHAFYFGGYELGKNILQKDRKYEEKDTWVHFTSGVIAELVSIIKSNVNLTFFIIRLVQ